MEKNLKTVSPFRLSSLLRLEKDPKVALRLFQNPIPNSSSSKPFRHSFLSYNLIISKLARAKQFHDMEQILLQMKQQQHRFTPKEALFCQVISSYGRSRMPDPALHTFDQIPSFGTRRTVRSLNSLLNALLNCREFEKIHEFYVVLDRYAIPDACTYNILINACCLNNSLQNAWNLFDEMRGRGIQPNVITFGTLISFLCANSMLDEAFKLKDDMVQVFCLKPNAFIYTSLIKGLCKKHELDLAFKLKDEMLSDEKVGLDSAVYSTLISGLFKAGRKEEVVEILEEMRKKGCKPDTVTYNAMIAGICSEKDFDSAFAVLDEMREKGLKPDVFSYNMIVAGLCMDGRLRDALDIFEDMPRRECFPDVVTYRTLFDSLCDGMKFKEAAWILDEMLFKGHKPRTASVQKFAESLLKEGDIDLSASVLSSLAKENAVDIDTWMLVIGIVCKKSELFEACKLVDNLRLT